MKLWVCLLSCALMLVGCGDQPPNSPYPKSENNRNILYTSFVSPPKTLDPVRSYAADEYNFMMQIVEPPLQYHYLYRPYRVVPLTATEMPDVVYLDKHHRELPRDARDADIAYTRYTIRIKPGRGYAPHPAFARDPKGHYYYHAVTDQYLRSHHIEGLSDFPHKSTRELTADDYVYQIKRLASPDAQSPIFELMSSYLVGFKKYADTLQQVKTQLKKAGLSDPYLDLRLYPFEGARALDAHQFAITIHGRAPQFIYWLTMPFFAPTPWEADYFYSQPGMKARNIGFDWCPVGTGPYQLGLNDPNSQMVLTRNPYYGGERYPTEGSDADQAAGLLADAGKPLPFVDEVIFRLEKESLPSWTKFLQGYYDISGVGSDSFDQAIRLDAEGKPLLTDEMQAKQMRLRTHVGPSDMYFAFNMADPIVGGNSQRARYLRQAISIAVNIEEYIAIFLNGRGIAANGPIPPGIFGHQSVKQDGKNPVVYQSDSNRRSLTEAKALLAKAGYPNGRDAKTGEPLMLNYDVPSTGGPDEKAQYDWLREQFAHLSIGLHIRATDYNRFQDNIERGKVQLFIAGWNADYPDPENFLFLFYGPNSVMISRGMNMSNYQNAEYDRLFEKMKNMPNSPERYNVIQKMVALLQQDSPWIWGYHPISFILSHQWSHAGKINDFANNTVKYAKINATLREAERMKWNRPLFYPVIMILIIMLAGIVPVYWHYRKRLNQSVMESRR